ncbi:AI-2E family transporter [soil metagenome]
MEPANRFERSPTGQERADQYRVLLIIGALAVVTWVLWNARSALFPFVLGMVIAYVLLPLVNRLETLIPDRGILHHVRRTFAVLVVYIVGIAVLVIAVMTIGPAIYRETTELVESVPNYWETLRNESNYWNRRYEEDVPEDIKIQIESNLDQVGSTITSAVQTGLLTTVGTVRRFVGIVFGLLILPLWLFYVLKDQKNGSSFFYSLWPVYLRGDVHNVVRIVDRVLGRYIRGQLFLGVVVGSVSGIGFWVIGVQQPLALGVVAGVLELVPILGPWISFLVAALVVLATDPSKIIPVAILCFMVQQLENTFLVPRVQGTAVQMNPAVIMILLVVGGATWGIIGVIVIVPLAAVARDVFVYIHGRLSGAIAIDEQREQPLSDSPAELPLESRNPGQ